MKGAGVDGFTAPLVERVVSKIAASPIRERPFPHIVVKQLLPPKVYAAVLAAFPARADMIRVDYPGTGFGRRGRQYHDFGYAYPALSTAGGPLGLIHGLFSSEAFGRALLEKLSQPLS